MIKITTWADGFGRWHAKVRVDGDSIVNEESVRKYARLAVADELNGRSNSKVTFRLVLIEHYAGSTAIGLDSFENWHYAEKEES